ncbi:major allergen Pru ar 1-like [Lotus japonicus]|uniref:major allergen Pru ar 1-like n=1 Tax=Lotus japonicus TaxID=34305 RepID=UPI0025836136|nr:major allergen Pru ar 1-like [Lotus japonicus]
MGVYSDTDEYQSPVSPARLFKALAIDAHNLIPKLLPQAVKSIEFIQGDGGAGSIFQVNFIEGSQVKTLVNRVDEINEDTFTYNYTLIEGETLKDKFTSIAHETKFEAAPVGGSISKVTNKYYLKGDVEIKEEEIKASKEKVFGIYKVVETYLLGNPDVYA